MSRGARARTGRARRLREPGGEPVTLEVPPGLKLRVSPAGFWKLCVANRDLRLERTAEGVVTINLPAGLDSSERNGELFFQLKAWVKVYASGKVFDSSAGVTLPNGAVRSPDACWINGDLWDALPPKERMRFGRVVPDFVAELCSPSDRRAEDRAKMREYLQQGVRLGWLIDPETNEVEIYRPGREPEVLSKPPTLSGEDVLPGFVLDLKGILFD